MSFIAAALVLFLVQVFVSAVALPEYQPECQRLRDGGSDGTCQACVEAVHLRESGLCISQNGKGSIPC
jgi:hypothetical protein